MKQVNTGVKIAATTEIPTAYNLARYGELTFTDIGEVLSIGEFGGAADEVQSQPLATGVTQFFSGFRQYGNPVFGMERDSSDAGQDILKSSFSTKAAISLRVTLPDGELIYLDGRVFSVSASIGSANSMIGFSVSFRVNKVPVYSSEDFDLSVLFADLEIYDDIELVA